MKTILVLMDSLNRHMLPLYADSWVHAPNLQRLAQKSVVFDNHWLGSAPCMPARRDIFTGRLNFLERNWGPIEPFDVTLPALLREHDVFTHMITDHYHYFEIGGENYCQLFNTWDFLRGQEYDPWVSRARPVSLPDTYYGKAASQYEANRTRFASEEDFSTPRTFASACRWLEDNREADNYFLTVEVFDPHEPFDCRDDYLELYDDVYDGPRYEWSGYAPVQEPSDATEHLRKRYAATLTMADRWLGRLLDKLEGLGLFEDTLFILTTDHGHMLGEHGFTGKNYMHVYNELAHLPLMMHLPGGERAGERVDALTQNIDLMPTVLDYHEIEPPKRLHGKSLRPLLEKTAESLRDDLLYGWFGKAVNITDGRYTYFRAPEREDNFPCFAYCGIPTTLWRYMGVEAQHAIETGPFLKHTDYPVYRIPIDSAREMGGLQHVSQSLLFNIAVDYRQERPLQDDRLEKQMAGLLTEAMTAADAPDDQFERLGLT